MTGSLLGGRGSNFANDSNSHVFLVPSTSSILVCSEEESKMLSYRECYVVLSSMLQDEDISDMLTSAAERYSLV